MLEAKTQRDAEGRQLLLMSDVHLGQDLKRRELRKAGSFDALRQLPSCDTDIAAMLANYRQEPGAWRLILAGDIFDFIGANVTPRQVGDTVDFAVSASEEAFGLEPGPAQSAWLAGLIVRRHPAFFDAIAEWVRAGHDVVFMRGNHDAALHWREVQDVFSKAVEDRLPGASASVVFEDWFYFEPDRIWVEHGHLHDDLSTDPGNRIVSQERPNRLAQPVTTLTLRYFCNKFPTLDLDDVDNRSTGRFVHWALFVENPIEVAKAFVQTMWLLLMPYVRGWLRLQRRHAHDTEDTFAAYETPTDEPTLVERAKAKFTRSAEGAERMARSLAGVVRRTATVSALAILRMFFLDRLAAMGAGASAATMLAFMPMPGAWKLGAIAVVVVLSVLADRWLVAARRVAIGPKMRVAAEDVAKLSGAPVIVMGHSHFALDTKVGDARYVNLGSWTPASREFGFPHLVVRGTDAQFLRWGGKAK